MAKSQFPIDGVPNKDWKITSPMGWRVHPVRKQRKHHNGTDIIGKGAKTYIEACFDGKVTYAGPSQTKMDNGEPSGFGYYVKITSQVNGQWYSHLYGHLQKGSIQVKAGQKVEAGTVLGVMGTTGMSTGVHLHLEVWKGKTHGWSEDGSGFLEPIEFIKTVIASEKVTATAQSPTPEDVVVPLAPTNEKAPATKASPSADVKAKQSSTPAPATTVKTYKVVSGDTLTKIASKHGTTVAKLVQLNGIKDANKINVGQVIKLS
jgi:murein DD-endopeptidase MepM/ murein hydrolase activator NlpD